MKATIFACGVMAVHGYLSLAIARRSGACEAPIQLVDGHIGERQLETDWLRQDQLRQRVVADAKTVSREDDAHGACDGIKTGRWGFHTENETNPWWQIDLGTPIRIDRVLLYNRCDLPERAAHIMICVSDDGKTFRQVYQHGGKAFFGFTDKKPLTVFLAGTTARYVRLQLPGVHYFHLDEVEIFPVDNNRNVALHKLATQSSTSQWSTRHASKPEAKRYATVEAIRRGLRLAANLNGLGICVDDERCALREVERRHMELPANAKDDARQEINFEARRIVRRLALRNPLLDFDSILFVKAAPGRFPHMSDQFYGWWSRPGGGVFVLAGFKGEHPQLRCLTADMPEGRFLRPDLSYDGKKVLFAYARYYPHVADLNDKADKANVPEDAFYHIYEMNIDDTGRRRLTRGRYDDFDARYLPNGDIVILSTRKGRFLPSTKANTQATTAADLPGSYVRCGGDNYWPVPVFTMHVMDAAGGNLRPISAFETFEWTPAVANDGTILYTGWDYIDRFNGHFFSLWSTNPDGTNARLVYGNYTVRPQVVCEARPIPNSQKLIFTASVHHSILGGSLVLLDPSRAAEGDAPIMRLTPEVPFPETEANVDCCYAHPWPLSQEHYLVGWADRKLPPHSRVDDTEQNPTNAMGLYFMMRSAISNCSIEARPSRAITRFRSGRASSRLSTPHESIGTMSRKVTSSCRTSTRVSRVTRGSPALLEAR